MKENVCKVHEMRSMSISAFMKKRLVTSVRALAVAAAAKNDATKLMIANFAWMDQEFIWNKFSKSRKQYRQ